jgi:2-oxoglutarate ferredoxin oxidoreductase subunit delta
MKGMIVIDEELCKGCTYCVNACLLGVIVIKDRFNKKGFFPASPKYPDKCTGCNMCAQMCPEIAIEVYREVGTSRSRKGQICQKDMQ